MPLLPPAAEFLLADRLRCDAAISLLQIHTTATAEILDLGCGSGMLLSTLRDAGWSKLKGIDPAPGAPSQALALYGLNCIQCGTLNEAATQRDFSATDVVCIMGVLEHLPRLESDLAQLRQCASSDSKNPHRSPRTGMFFPKSI
ncbi:MAG: class I SAM-dependent methyltransferase [Rhodocyclaceae bacterium]|nr:class I SAM-dependent methyltransferase [Rhodocyclaceae bacterium]